MGKKYEGRIPDEFFQESFYLAHNPDVAVNVGPPGSGSAATPPGLSTLCSNGQKEGRVIDPFATRKSFYLAQNPDVAAAVQAGTFVSGFEHFLLYGQSEGTRVQQAL